jgi:hypothetical protein
MIVLGQQWMALVLSVAQLIMLELHIHGRATAVLSSLALAPVAARLNVLMAFLSSAKRYTVLVHMLRLAKIAA